MIFKKSSKISFFALLWFVAILCPLTTFPSQLFKSQIEKEISLHNPENTSLYRVSVKEFSEMKGDSFFLPNKHFFSGIRQKYDIQVSSSLRDKQQYLFKNKFEPMILEYKPHMRFKNNLVELDFHKRFDLSYHHRFTQHPVLKAYLQKSDFEMIAGQLSLRDINRFQFRKNRIKSDEIPIETPDCMNP